MNEMELLDAATVSGLPKDRFDQMERSYNSRSYRCALHMRAIVEASENGSVSLAGNSPWVEWHRSSAVCPAQSLQSSDLITQEPAYFDFRKEPNYFTRLNNYN